MKKVILLFLCTLLTYATYAQATCAGALTLTPGIQQCGDSAGQVGDFPNDGSAPNNPCDSDFNDDEYWFEYTAVSEGESLDLTVSAITSTWAGIFVLDDCPSGSPSCINFDDNTSGTADLSLNTGPLASGTSYKIVITNYGTPDNTAFCLDAVVQPPVMAPANDDCGGALALTVNADLSCGSTTSGTVLGATASPEDDTACSGTEDDDVWFSFMATATSHVIDLQNASGSDTDLYHSVWEGTCGSLTLVAGSCSDPNASTVSGLTIGNTYYLRVYTWTATAGQNTTFDVCIGTAPPPPSNDECSGATPIACDDVLTGESTASSTDNGDVTGCFMGAGVWYEFTGIDAQVTVSVQAEAGFDHEIAVASSSDCIAFSNIGCDDGAGGGGLEEITFTSALGTTYYIYVGHFSSATFGEFDISVTCSSCIEPTFTLSNGTNNCPTGTEYNLVVDVTDLGSATTVDIIYDDGSGPQTVTGVGAGPTGIGPFAPGADVDVTVVDNLDGTCSTMSSITTPATCPPINDECAGAISIPGNDCTTPQAGNTANATQSLPGCLGTADDDIWFSFEASAVGHTITIANVSGTDDIVTEIFDACGGSSLECQDEPDSPIMVTGLTISTTYYIRVYSYSSSASVTTEFTICVEETPPPPSNDECSTPDPLAESLDDGCAMAVSGSTVSATLSGTDQCSSSGSDVWYTFTPSTTGEYNFEVTETNDQGDSDTYVSLFSGSCGGLVQENSSCFSTSFAEDLVMGTTYLVNVLSTSSTTGVDFDLCAYPTPPPPPAPANNDLCNAEAIIVDAAPISGTNVSSDFEADESAGSCWGSTTEDNSVWYSFVAPGSGLVEITTDFATDMTDSQISLYTVGDCSDLLTATEIDCDEDDGFVGSGFMSYIETSGAPLTGGNTYYVQVDGYGTAVGEFMIQVNELAPENDDCADAAVLANNTTGSLIDQYFAKATASGMGAEACDGSATATPGDVWYSINTDADGGNLIIVVEPGMNSDVVVAVYDACGSAIPEACVDNGAAENGTGNGVETINFTALFQNPKGNTSSTRDADYFVRVYEKVPSGEPFEIGAQGEALPIIIGSFEATAEKRGNRVQWSTLLEINSDFVEVQSSPNGSNRWEVVGKVVTKGESNSKLDYELFDYNPYEVTYYRLNAVDKDGESEFSRTINVKRSEFSGRMTLSPNPATSIITIQTNSVTEELASISVMDMTGSIIKKESVSLRKGLNTMNLNLDDLQAGIYLFSLQTENGIQVEKFVKQ